MLRLSAMIFVYKPAFCPESLCYLQSQVVLHLQPYSLLSPRIIISIKMKFTTLTNALLLAGTVTAAPGTAIRRARAARQSKPLNPVDGLTALGGPNNSHVQYSGNWAGAVLVGTGYTSVTGTFTVPTPTTDGWICLGRHRWRHMRYRYSPNWNRLDKIRVVNYIRRLV
jgi:hypothetical protein